MRQRWPWAARAASVPAGDDGRWGVARLVAEREAAARAVPAGPDEPDEPAPDPAPVPRRPVPVAPPRPRAPLPVPPPPLPRPRRPESAGPAGFDERLPRPRVEPDLSLFGFARHTRGQVGSRLFRLFFLLVFALILVQTIASIV